MQPIISDEAIKPRENWVEKIKVLSGNFSGDTKKMEEELAAEIQTKGPTTLIDHLRLCGNIPESYKHDSSEEKLYSKYTDSLLSFADQQMGLNSNVLTERTDAADVEAFAKSYSFVADAKAFRVSRTAKNQKDFKIEALDGWKQGKDYAMVVGHIYQFPTRSSQIYEQSSRRNVCIFTYSHLSLLVNYALKEGSLKSETLLHEIFKTVEALKPGKRSQDYWSSVNQTMLEFSEVIRELWTIEKKAAGESTKLAKKEALNFLAAEREKIMGMSHDEALQELITVKIESKLNFIDSIRDSQLFDIE
jgi:type II restriction enzyme